MCPCKICFPNGEECAIQCNEKHVSCPLIDATLFDEDVSISNFSSTNSESNKEEESGNKSKYKILQQPTYLPNLTDIYTNRAIEVMETNTAIEKPFFLYFAYHQTHHPQFSGTNFGKILLIISSVDLKSKYTSID